MVGELDIIVLDTPDVKGLSAFYEQVAGVTVTDADDEWVTTATPEGWQIAFQRADDHVPARWPDPVYPQQLHLDLLVPDLGAAVGRAEQAGATRLPGGGETIRVYADPVGHPFCLVW
ncbi:MAG: VOC family protein [Actinomycetales bacterium]|nr:VOC family protein [Actinomycetales bacterium]